jgi:hypothetical protein
MAAATARPVVNRFPEFDVATPTREANSSAVAAMSREIGSVVALLAP